MRSYASGERSATNSATSRGEGGRPVRSREARRSNVGRSASGEKVSPRFSNSASRKASMGLRTRLMLRSAGRFGRTGRRNAQKSRSASVMLRSLPSSAMAVATSPASSCRYQSSLRMRAFSWADNFCLPGGILSPATFSQMRLFSDAPGMSAGPLSPPLSMAALLRMSRSAFCLSAPWQERHLVLNSGSTSFSKTGIAGASAAPCGSRAEKGQDRQRQEMQSHHGEGSPWGGGKIVRHRSARLDLSYTPSRSDCQQSCKQRNTAARLGLRTRGRRLNWGSIVGRTSWSAFTPRT